MRVLVAMRSQCETLGRNVRHGSQWSQGWPGEGLTYVIWDRNAESYKDTFISK